ncbi:MAG TPA: hypothetical protein VGX23_33775 [Actinocrinis sp.]|nr:hypothetical protein [Actinocrinis sp.]
MTFIDRMVAFAGALAPAEVCLVRRTVLLDMLECQQRQRDTAYADGYDGGFIEGMDAGYRQARAEADQLQVTA